MARLRAQAQHLQCYLMKEAVKPRTGSLKWPKAQIPRPPMIELQELEFRYPGAKSPTLKNIDLQIRKGEIFGFLGPSGAGKSTTLNILIRLLSGWTGQIKMMGKSLEEWGPQFYDRIGVSFELPNHYLKLSAKENLEYFASLYDVRTHSAIQVLEWVGLQDAVDKAVQDFSKGMKNRLSLARSLIHGPELWFLDEPTSGLDPVNVQKVQELILRQREQGVTVIITTHNMEVADALCDRVAFLVDGEIAACEAPEQLKTKHGKRELAVRYGPSPDKATECSFPLDGLAQNVDFQALLAKERLLSMHSQETTLGGVFVELTGRSLK